MREVGFWSWALMMMLSVAGAGQLRPEPPEHFPERVTVMSYDSQALGRGQPFLVVRPAGKVPAEGWPVLFVLHGHGRHHLTLWENETTRAMLLQQSHLLVMPDTGAGWYVDSPVDPAMRYEAALDELIEVVARDFPVVAGREGWGIVGWSMGGYGAVRNGARRNDRFSFVGSMIGLLDFPRIEGLPEGQRYRVPRAVFGEDREVWAQLNPMRMIDALGRTEVLVVVAEQAFDRTMNEHFIAAATLEQVPLEVVRLPGGHTFPVVSAALPHVFAAAHRHFFSSQEAP